MKNSTPLVSVVLPIFNVDDYLDQSVSSILNQTYKNLEVILVDDGSEDSCPEKCDHWAARDSRIRVIHKQNQGLGMARNSGIEVASGDYICFFDSDDFVDSIAIEQCVSRAMRDQSDFVIFGMRSVSTDGCTVLGEVVPRCPKTVFDGDEVRSVFLPFYIGPNWETGENWCLMASACACFIDRQLLIESNFKFVSERELISEDVYSMLGLFRYVCRVSVIDRAFYNYRVNPVSLTHVFRFDRLQRIKEFYLACIRLANEAEFSSVVLDRLMEPYASFVIAALKDLAKSNEANDVIVRQFLYLATDEVFKNVANELCKYRHLDIKRRILFRLIERKWITCALMLCRLR